MIDASNLGRYEYIGGSSAKYWHVIFNKTDRTYLAQWGRIGRDPQGEKEYTEDEVRKKVREKLKKGYSKAQGYQEESGANSLNFIMQD
jgi:predicted DNA-binding WGR domain protein